MLPDLPELILKRKFSRKDYDDIIKIVLKVRNLYLAEQAQHAPDRPLALIAQITDDDLIPLALFDEVLT